MPTYFRPAPDQHIPRLQWRMPGHRPDCHQLPTFTLRHMQPINIAGTNGIPATALGGHRFATTSVSSYVVRTHTTQPQHRCNAASLAAPQQAPLESTLFIVRVSVSHLHSAYCGPHCSPLQPAARAHVPSSLLLVHRKLLEPLTYRTPCKSASAHAYPMCSAPAWQECSTQQDGNNPTVLKMYPSTRSGPRPLPSTVPTHTKHPTLSTASRP